MTELLEVEVGMVYDATLLKIVDAKYVIVELETGEELVTTMFEFGAITPFLGYEGVWQRDIDQNIVVNGTYRLKILGFNAQTKLPQVTFLDSKSKACEAFALQEGWAFPQTIAFDSKSATNDYRQSVISAYKNKKGGWNDQYIRDTYTSQLMTEIGIQPRELTLTYFQAHKGISIILFVFVAIFVADYMSKQRAQMRGELEDSHYGFIRRNLWKVFAQHKRTFTTTKKKTPVDGSTDE